MKNLGESGIEAILCARAGGPFRGLVDFCRRTDLRRVNKRVLEGLIGRGALDSLEKPRAALFRSVKAAMELGQSFQGEAKSGQLALFGESETGPAPFRLPSTPEWESRELLEREHETLGFYCSGHPLDEFEGHLAATGAVRMERLAELSDGTPVELFGLVSALRVTTTRKGERMAFVTLEDQTGRVDLVLFPELYRSVPELGAGSVLAVNGYTSKTEARLSVIATGAKAVAEI